MTSRTARSLLLLWLVCASACPGGSSAAESAAPKAPAAAQAPASPAAPAQTNPAVVLLPPGHDAVSVKVEVARTEDERRRGLMFRKHMDEDAGMLFLFEHPQQLTFWMHNTYIPLDMVFIDKDLRVLGVVENAEPLTDSTRAVPGFSQYVLEVNAGFGRRYGLGAGTAVRFENIEVGHGP